MGLVSEPLYQVADLNRLIDPASDWVLEDATAVNDNGSIVGWGETPSTKSHAFLLTSAVHVAADDKRADDTPAEASEY